MRGNREYLLDNSVNKRTSNALNLFWAGFIIYTLSFTLSVTPSSTKIYHAIQLLSLVLIFTTVISLFEFKIENKYLKIFFVMYCSWSLIVILRGFHIDNTFIKSMLYDLRFGILPYFAPLILLFPTNLAFYKKLFNVIIILGASYVIFDVLFIRELLSTDRTNLTSQFIIEIFATTLGIPSAFILLTYTYHSNKRNLFALGIIIITLFFAIIRARRSLIFTCESLLIFSYLLYLFKSKNRLLIIASSIFILLIGIIFIKDIDLQKKNNIFSFLIDRGTEDTRSGVELYFYDDMKAKDWAFGKGMSGEYFCPDIEPDQITNYRGVIETGYLQIILKGGLISLGLFLLIAIPAIIKGLFYSKNILSKAAAIWIFLSIINLYPYIENIFTLKYLIFWISIGICYSKTVRNIPENKMKSYFLSS